MIATALHNEKVKNSQNPLADVFGSDGAAHLKRLLLHKADKIRFEIIGGHKHKIIISSLDSIEFKKV